LHGNPVVENSDTYAVAGPAVPECVVGSHGQTGEVRLPRYMTALFILNSVARWVLG
jgi:hypothetical protein